MWSIVYVYVKADVSWSYSEMITMHSALLFPYKFK